MTTADRDGSDEAWRPAWWDDARMYLSLIGEGSAQPVEVFEAPDGGEPDGDSPGKLRLSLEPRFRHSPRLRVLDAGGREEGLIRAEGLAPGLRYTMRRDGGLLWTMSVRSIFRDRYALERVEGDRWAIRTPSFLRLTVTGASGGAPRLLGDVGSEGMWAWWFWVEPGRDTTDLLAAVAFLHRQWAHS